MGHERLKHIKQNLLTCIEGQMCNIQEADAEELGAAVDMLKDLEEALYYCTITEAMEGKGDSEFKLEGEKHREHMQYNDGGRSYYPMPMYYDSGMRSYNNGGTSSGSRGSSMSYDNGGQRRNSNGEFMSNYSEPMMTKDHREGRSPEVRRMYMEAKENNGDKGVQMRELEHYMQELSSDVVEMIQESTSEEKQFLEKRLLALASKIGQMK